MIDGMLDLWPQLNERSEAQTWHDGFAVRRNLFCSNDLVARLQVSAHDLGKIIVVPAQKLIRSGSRFGDEDRD